MERIYLLDTEDLTQYGFIHANVEESILINVIWRVQHLELQPAIGSPLYRKLLTLTDTGLTTGVYYDLMAQYVVPYLIAAVEYKATYHTSTEIQNKGTGNNKDEYMSTGDLAQLNTLRSQLSKDANELKNLLIRFLQDDCNSETPNYPEYKERTGNRVDYTPEQTGPDYENEISII